jgi:tetratricopeptide (TPR) repeat protein
VLLVTLAYSMATLAKESAAVLPLLIFLLDAARRDTRLASAGSYVRDRFTLFASMGAALTLVLLARTAIVGGVAAASLPPGGEILREAPRVWTVFSTWPHYLRLLFFPVELAADYSPGVIPIAFGWNTSAALGAVVGLLFFGGAWWSWRRGSELSPAKNNERIPGLGLLWIAGAMLPVSNVLFLGPVLVAERTFYLASWGACLALGWLLVSLAEVRGRVAIALAALLILGGTARTMTRVPDWKDADTIMNALIETRPQSGVGWLALGRRLANQGRQAEALTAYSHAVTLMNSEYNPSTQIATHLMTLGRVDSARFFLERAWREHPEWYSAPGLLAAVELNAGRPGQAAAAARAATVLEPNDPSMQHLLAQALGGSGDWSGAARARRASIDTGFADRVSSWLQLAGDLLNAADSSGASLALDSASVRTLNADQVETLAELRSALDARDR